MAILMFVDGVLRSSTGSPIPQGFKLYRTLKEVDKIFLLCEDKARDDKWLRDNKINLVDDLVGRDIPFMTDDPEWRQIEYCRGQGQVDLVITSNTELVHRLLVAGVTTLMFLHPLYLTEKFRPDSRQGVKSWKAIAEEIRKQQDFYDKDPRTK